MQRKVYCPVCWNQLKKQKLKIGKSHKYCYVCSECYYVVVIKTSILLKILNLFKRKRKYV